MKVDAVVLDIDGVLVDVADSYRRAIVESVLCVYGDTIPKRDVQLFKNAGGFNNDWELTHATALYILARNEGLAYDLASFTDAIEASGGGLAGARTVIANAVDPDVRERIYAEWDRERLTTVFQQLYLGNELYRKLHDREPDLDADGFIHDEPVLVTPDTVAWLADQPLGIVTGRPAAEAAIALDRTGIDVLDERLFTMDSDTPGKPAPDALISLTERFDGEANRVAFAGDTLDDIKTVHNAADADPEREYYAIGVQSGGLSGERGRQAFENAGADEIIETVNELPTILGS
ncbi:TIGR01548 family HAD-type hydrolase [Halocatena pleomorpha]|uniref:TIGR01548 family HAD-type hydrolase n=1 Tax=Halocatena pleomorpha TaxID=1785090 RepID=A0A3P3RIZ0_9EURY|nr:TIGR01548 family HAD-type hydrolase [Halocatena pleomorpha]RRJ33517.1 TIGR01548 family HAD-type hydrolase [Halocatena pleomorpha]